MHTHYDNLKVARNAPQAVIKAAYRALSSEHHPDRSTRADATRIMQIINDAWEVLGDPAKRAAYDRKIADEERNINAGRAAQARVEEQHARGTYQRAAQESAARERPARDRREAGPRASKGAVHEWVTRLRWQPLAKKDKIDAETRKADRETNRTMRVGAAIGCLFIFVVVLVVVASNDRPKPSGEYTSYQVVAPPVDTARNAHAISPEDSQIAACLERGNSMTQCTAEAADGASAARDPDEAPITPPQPATQH